MEVPSAPALELVGLERSFPIALGLRRRPALRGIDLSLEQGRVLGLVGPNGSGKSTLLRLAAGVDRPSAGTVRVLGADPRSRAVRSRLAYLPEDSPFPGELSPDAILALIGDLHGWPRRAVRERGRELLSTVGLAQEARLPLGRFSRGMLRRFGLAQAFLGDPELVLLDEPTAGLDALGFEVLDGLLRQARGRGATLVFASHLLSDVHAHCDRLAVLVAGQLAELGTPAEVLAAEGRVHVELEGLDEEGLEALRGWSAERGGRVVRAQPAGKTLVELYRRASPGEGRRG